MQPIALDHIKLCVVPLIQFKDENGNNPFYDFLIERGEFIDHELPFGLYQSRAELVKLSKMPIITNHDQVVHEEDQKVLRDFLDVFKSEKHFLFKYYKGI